ncbi:Uncharacterised protein [Mycobacteroides abscessus subsp. abscessus]|nr:Uncharacterised protein [Mycobacteroides abscessus subsp. abscessus]
MASWLPPLTMCESSGPKPPTAVADSSMTVLRFSLGTACRPLVSESITVLMSGGTEVCASGMTSPSLSGREFTLRGVRDTNCSPIAIWLCTSACTSDGMSVPEFSDSSAWTPVGVNPTDCTRPTTVPR